MFVKTNMITEYEGGTVTVLCFKQNPLNQHLAEWCKDNGACVTGKSGNIDGAFVLLRQFRDTLIVTMRRLTVNNTGLYSCSVAGPQIHITVQGLSER